jgi:hypothetical protein
MGQYKFYINYGTQFLFGFIYDKDSVFELQIACFTLGLGLTESAKGLGLCRK